ncbi:MAG: hypothetical protein AB7S41_01800 [Parvibaculaceae bacterium]
MAGALERTDMMQLAAQGAFDSMLTTGRIGADDVVMLSRSVFPDGIPSREAAEWMFALDDLCEAETAEWRAYFVETLAGYVVDRAEPSGHVSEETARWLTDRIAAGGVVKTPRGLELLVKVIERAHSAPQSLAVFALEQVKHVALRGRAPIADSGVDATLPLLVAEDSMSIGPALRSLMEKAGAAA